MEQLRALAQGLTFYDSAEEATTAACQVSGHVRAA
jgi:hypothetical protein